MWVVMGTGEVWIEGQDRTKDTVGLSTGMQLMYHWSIMRDYCAPCCVNHLPLAPDLRGKPACRISLLLDNTFIAYRREREIDSVREENNRNVETGWESRVGERLREKMNRKVDKVR